MEREREQQMINKIEIDTHYLVKWNDQIKLGRIRQRAWQREKQHKKVLLKVNQILEICKCKFKNTYD